MSHEVIEVIEVGPPGPPGPQGPDGVVQVYEQADAPVGALEGAIWIETDVTPNVIRVNAESGWKDLAAAGPPGPPGPGGGLVQADLDAAIAAHSSSADHDGRYYTEAEVITALFKPYAKVRRVSIGYPISSGSFQVVAFNEVMVDNENIAGSGADRLRPNSPGWYEFAGEINFSHGEGYFRAVRLMKPTGDGIAIGTVAQTTGVATSSWSLQVFGQAYCDGVSDYVQIQAYQDSGVGLYADSGSWLSAKLIVR